MTDIAFGPLRSRKTPAQARAVQRVHQILQATADVLATRAPHELSTTLIADKAAIPVSSIYRYFPTLEDVLRELYLQTSGELRETVFAIFSDASAYPTWQARLTATVETQRAYLARHPFYRPLLLLFQVNRGPVAVHEDDHHELVAFFEARWRKGGDGFQGGDPAIVARTAIQISLSMEDLIAVQQGAAAAPYLDETIKLLTGYLSHYLSDDR